MDLSRVINNPRLSQQFTVYRQSGSWVSGRWVSNPEQTLSFTGIISTASPEDLVQVPEGDRSTEARVFYTTERLYNTHSDTAGSVGAGTSDEALWNGKRYRLYSVPDYHDYGYFKAVGTRKDGG